MKTLTPEQQQILANVKMPDDWKHALATELTSSNMDKIRQFLRDQYHAQKVIYPSGSQMFNAFNLTPLSQVKVVILGQDPYHGAGQAHGLSFSVQPGVKVPWVKRGARPGDLVALLSATGAQTETIPPSLVLITIGSVTGVSIAALFTGGLLPGLVLAVMLCIVVWQRYRGEDLSHVSKASLGMIAKSFVIALPAVALPFIIRAAVVGGVATATEVSTIGIVYSALCGLLLYRRFDWRRLSPMLIETAALSGAILLIIGAATGMAWALTQSGFSTALARFMTNLPGGAPMFLAVTIVAFIVLGSVLEGIPAIVLFGPLLFPIAKQIGIHEVHYAMVVILAMGIGLFAPPFGVGYYAACAISRIHPDLGIRPMLGYTLALLIGTIVIAAVPWFSIGLLR